MQNVLFVKLSLIIYILRISVEHLWKQRNRLRKYNNTPFQYYYKENETKNRSLVFEYENI